MSKARTLENMFQRVKIGFSQALASMDLCAGPDFIIVGAQKAGTTALWSYLKYHPNLRQAHKKEIHYFCYDLNYLNKGESWYHAHFPIKYRVSENQLCYEASPNYLYFEKTFERLAAYDANIKLIVVLRDPVERALSNWNHLARKFVNRDVFTQKLRLRGRSEADVSGLLRLCDRHGRILSFREAVEIELYNGRLIDDIGHEPSIVRKGLYFVQIKSMHQHIPPINTMIIDSAELRSDTERTLNDICDFLDVPRFTWPQQITESVFEQKHICGADPESLLTLRDFYRPHNERLFKYLGIRFDWC